MVMFPTYLGTHRGQCKGDDQGELVHEDTRHNCDAADIEGGNWANV